ncbi:MAG TPA: CrcB family protein [Planctomycetota bacterium]|nr:CrcB family protein [Planctomycetota bacterium]
MTRLLLAGAGGFLGSVARYGISLLMAPLTGTFPWATLAINVAGCFLIGLAMPWVEGRPEWLVFVVPGVLGGFTTFSAFGHETHRLAQGNSPLLAAVYVVASVGFGLAAVWVGRGLAK